MRTWVSFAALAALMFTQPAAAAAAPDAPGKITGIGGVFVTSKDPKALAAWYRDVLGVPLEPWGGAIFHNDAPGRPPVATWSAFREGGSYLKPSQRDFMLDFAVDDLDAMLTRLQAKGVTIRAVAAGEALIAPQAHPPESLSGAPGPACAASLNLAS
jgi:catechol 2,3-dioxygenase-like lactoylglutathione lyase family enzyme